MMKSVVLILIFLFCFIGNLRSQFSEKVQKEALADVYENPDNTIKLGLQMLKKEKNPDHLIRIYKLLSSAYISKRDFDRSLDYVLEMKELSKTFKDPEQKVKVLNSIAIQYQSMGLYGKTIEVLDEHYKASMTLQDSPFKFFYLGLNYVVRGLVYKNQNNNELALNKLSVGLNYLYRSGDYENSAPNISITLYNMGYCYFYLNNLSEAEKYFKKSADIARSVPAESLEAFAYKGLAETYTIQGKHAEAVELLQKAENISQKVGDLVLSEGIYRGFADNYLVLQNWNSYEWYNKRYTETKFKKEQNELASLNKSIDAQNNENTKKIKEQELKLQIIIYLLSIITLVSSYFILKKMIHTRKINKTFTQKLTEINRITS